MKLKYLIPVVSLVAASAYAAPESFDFKDPKGVNVATFRLDAPLESVNGSASGITGTVVFDPANPAATTGTIVVASDSLTVPNPLQKEHLHSANWLDVATFPQITFETKSLSDVKTEGDVTTATVTGIFTLHGVSKEVSAPVKFTYLKDKLGARVPGMKGDLLVIRSDFSINREDFNIEKGKFEDKVANEIDLNLSVAGASVQP